MDNNWELRVAVRNKLWPLDPSRCLVCGWEINETIEEGCTKDSCSLRPTVQRWQRYDFPPDPTREQTQIDMLRNLRKWKYRYMIIWTGSLYTFQVWGKEGLPVVKHNENLGIAIAEAILEVLP